MVSPIEINIMRQTSSFKSIQLLIVMMVLTAFNSSAQHAVAPAKPRVFVIVGTDQNHKAMVLKARKMFETLAGQNNFEVHYTTDTAEIATVNLSRYSVLIQFNLAPLALSTKNQFAIQQFISRGKGWIGIHAAGLSADQFRKTGNDAWKWYERFLGEALYTPLPPVKTGAVNVTNRNHPVMKNLPPSFNINEEWYAFDKAPLNAVVLASDAKGQPLIWTNPALERALFIAIGHDESLCDNDNYKILLRDAIAWAADQTGLEERKREAFSKANGSILVNQIGYNRNLAKHAVFKSDTQLNHALFRVVNAMTLETVYTGKVQPSEQVSDWNNTWYSKLDFTAFNKEGYYRIDVEANNKIYESFAFEIGDHILAQTLVPAIANFFHGQKANSKEELEGDEHVRLFGSDKTVDLRGGWCDASGDVSKYFSHLAYTNFMSPQQIPLADWSMIQSVESIPASIKNSAVRDSLVLEAFYGADYIMKSLSPEGYFYMTLFSYFKKDPSERRVVGLLADSKTTSEYQAGYREGGGMGVACLARISNWKQKSKHTQEEYLQAAERAFAHLQQNSVKYIDDHKENIIDDYTALMGSTELWIATEKPVYQTEARARARRLEARMSDEGFFWTDDEKTRPFWHASDAGLPIISLIRYLDIETDQVLREKSTAAIKKFIDYQMKVSKEVTNPFEYPRQTFRVQNKIRNGFFIPHENESGWWWQGEDARIGSLATVLIRGGRIVYPEKNALGIREDIAVMAGNLINWVLGCNPYQVCMMYGYGQINVPYMAAMYGHGSGIGGISNGITGAGDRADGSGIEFKFEDNGNEWRWSEQWIPHSAWFLQAITAIESKMK